MCILEPPPPVKTSTVVNPHAIARPRATPSMLQRQGSCRGFSTLNEASPFKRQLSLHLPDLPSNKSRKNPNTNNNTNATVNGGDRGVNLLPTTNINNGQIPKGRTQTLSIHWMP